MTRRRAPKIVLNGDRRLAVRGGFDPALVNRRGNYLKLVYWDRTGFCLFAKRLERGRFVFPGTDRTQALDAQSFRLLLDGIVLGRSRRMR